MQILGCLIGMITQIGTSAAVNIRNFVLINKQFCGNGWGWNNISAGTNGDGMEVLWGWVGM